jgi:phosphoenolpyruvate phosphomutase
VQAVPDANILTLTETLEAVRRICDAVSIPVVADCDNGYGNAINVIRTASEFERAGAAGICIEDNEFPKRCSFYAGVRRDLVPADEHARKIEAACSARRSPDFASSHAPRLSSPGSVSTRRCRARVRQAGATQCSCTRGAASRSAALRARAGAGRRASVPLVAVPPPDVGPDELSGRFRSHLANQPLRAAIVAMRDALLRLRESGRASSVDDRIVPLEEVYRLVGVPELKANERRFLFAGVEAPKAIILAAGFEPQLLPLTQDRPKTMLEVKGKSILERQVEALGRLGIRDVVVVRGYQKDQVTAPGVRFVDNDRFADTGELYSLFCAETELTGPCVVLYGDMISRRRCWRSWCARPRTSPSSWIARSRTRCAPGSRCLPDRSTWSSPRRRRTAGVSWRPRAAAGCCESGRRSFRRRRTASSSDSPCCPLPACGRCARSVASWRRSVRKGSNARASRTSSRP